MILLELFSTDAPENVVFSLQIFLVLASSCSLAVSWISSQI